MVSKPVAIRPEVLNDLASRFLINIPDEDKDDPVKLCSHIELAHWFYLDLQRPGDPSFPACSMKEFMATIFHHCPFLVRDSVAKDLDKLIAQWKSHKYKKPARGAIILNQDLTKCLLVQGYPASTSWGFPKGKLEKGENDKDAAIREVYEETGLDIRDLIQEYQFLEAKVGDNVARMYIIPGVLDSTTFAPKTRKEIRAIQWFKIEDLPRHRKDLTSKQALGKSANTFFLIIPFMNILRKWISTNQQKSRVAPPNRVIRSTHKPTRGVSAMFPSSGSHDAQTTSTPTAIEFPSAIVTAMQEESIVNTSFQVSPSPHTPYAHTASSGLGHPGTGIGTGPFHSQVTGMGPSHIQVTGMGGPSHNQVTGMGPSHIQVTGMGGPSHNQATGMGPSHNQVTRMGPPHIQVTGLTYPGNQMEHHLLRSPSAPILLEPLRHSSTTSPQLLHFHREHLAPVLRSNTTPISHPPPPFSSLLTYPSPQPTNRQPLSLAPLRPHQYLHRAVVYPPYLAQPNGYYYGSAQVPPAAVTMATRNVNIHPVPTPSHPVVRYAVSSQPSPRPQYITKTPSPTPQPAASLSSTIQLKPAVAFTEFAFNKKPILACLK